ncbi:epoxide hydrolase [Nonomuraea glycinis]|uniref:Microsomal epoxide hydrolase n=1 Tax=Nonomuraea glycinis TaxID=2047744 RepID=A0A918A530_9ACTN|nr:epoxide hydrolase family protein [Nonomuraea glycinis]MCA2176421.1 epoxide hydrolase [Nonomuraea glycinis]GGP07201.1 microsomal epoxide hydrolase [Nonomuraea glycinis]
MPGDTALRPFRIAIPQADLDDLRARLARTRWPDDAPAPAWSYGVPVGYLKSLTDHWMTAYDWRVHEAELNRFPQVTTVIDGERLHALHVRSPEPGALPLILSHGWPGSIVEFMKVIGPLTDPRGHGADPADAFHVVAPSLPGFAFSGPARSTGWSLERIARAWAQWMHRLGYARYGAQGGDTGSLISPVLGRIAPDQVVGVHVNGALGFPTGDRSGYSAIQSTRPQTLAYGLHDSPAGQLAWIVEKFKEWTDPAAELPEDAVDRDQLLTNVTVYWLTGTAGSAARLYKDGAMDWSQPLGPSRVPTGVAVFPGDAGIRRVAEQNDNVVHWSEFDRGGHFAAMEAPDLLVTDIRAFFRPLR